MPKSEAQIHLEGTLEKLWPRMWEAEYKFFSGRQWRCDYAVETPNWEFGIEIEGGVFTQGRHTRGLGYQKDIEKYNHAALIRYTIFRFSTQQVLSGYAEQFLKIVQQRCGS